MKGYKAFNKDMTCKGFQYKEGNKILGIEIIYRWGHEKEKQFNKKD